MCGWRVYEGVDGGWGIEGEYEEARAGLDSVPVLKKNGNCLLSLVCLALRQSLVLGVSWFL